MKITCHYCKHEYKRPDWIFYLHMLCNRTHIHLRCPECAIVSTYWLDLRVVHDVVNEKKITHDPRIYERG